MNRSQCRSARAAFLISILSLAIPAGAGTVTVKSIADAGGTCPGPTCTLRQAIATAASGDTVDFSLPANGTITLTTAELLIDKDLTIAGPGANLLTVARSSAAGVPNFRIFKISTATTTTVVTISGLTITNGRIDNGGGGIFHVSGELKVINCNVTVNFGYTGAGVWSNAATKVEFIGSTISNNTATTEGGGITVFGEGTMTNCTVVGNTAQGNDGGGVFSNFDGSIFIRSSTIYGNTAVYGGGIASAGSFTPVIQNTIVAGNTATNGSDVNPNLRGGAGSNGNNIIGSVKGTVFTAAGSDQVGVSNAQLALSPLQDNGGPTPTMKLLVGSVAIDRGLNAFTNIDQRGEPRPSDRPEPNGFESNGSDVGAVELGTEQTGPTFIVTTIQEHNDGVCTTDDCSLVEALNVTNAVADANTINFLPGLAGAIGTAILTPSGLAITNPVTINGPGARILGVTGRTAARVFRITSPNVNISGLGIVNGKRTDDNGGAIHNTGGLSLTECTINNSVVAGSGANGGGIYNANGASLTLTRSSVTNSTAGQFGGTPPGSR